MTKSEYNRLYGELTKRQVEIRSLHSLIHSISGFIPTAVELASAGDNGLSIVYDRQMQPDEFSGATPIDMIQDVINNLTECVDQIEAKLNAEDAEDDGKSDANADYLRNVAIGMRGI